MKLLLSLLLFVTSATGFSQQTDSAWRNIKNPVLPNIADAGVLRYNGEYYIGGVLTLGSFFRTKDLVKWEGPFHVMSMNNKWTSGASAGDNQIHANDMVYWNGVFHLYWSVNYWGRDRHAVHVAYAKSKKVLGPYDEPVKETWVTNRIDPKLYIDDDGKCYLYMVKFTDGNTIWVQPMASPDSLLGEPKYLFASLPNTWETRDNRVEEGPWVMKYRKRYYLMFNANHTGTAWGNYALGVAEADSPTDFNHGNKYPYPLLQSNQIELEDHYPDLLKFNGDSDLSFQYTTSTPKADWNKNVTDSAGWSKGRPGFGSAYVKGSTSRAMRTSWGTPEIWTRRTFRSENNAASKYLLRIHHDGPAEVYLNGEKIYEGTQRTYKTVFLTAADQQIIRSGENVLAVHARAGNNSNFLDVSLFQTDEKAEQDVLFSPGQPNILRGPNGFEWWLIYMANRNSDRRGQYIQRIHFFNKRMYSEQVTGPTSAGYHPEPSRPQFADLFDSSSTNARERWVLQDQNWKVQGGEFQYNGKSSSSAMFKSETAENYLVEVNLALRGDSSRAGVIAYYKDPKNWLRIGLDAKKNKWFSEFSYNGKITKEENVVRPNFNAKEYHELTIYRNAKQFVIRIDDHPVVVIDKLASKIEGVSSVGLFGEKGESSFDGVLQTIGWDEFDETITGWKTTDQKWKISSEGYKVIASTETSVTKGDLVSDYEFSTHIKSDEFSGIAGVYAAYHDENNYLKSTLDFAGERLIISGKQNGKELETKTISLSHREEYYPDMKHTDGMDKVFTLVDQVRFNEIFFNKIPQNNPDTLINDIHEKFNISYRKNGKWYPIENFKLVPQSHNGLAKIAFEKVDGDAVRFINKGPQDGQFYLNRVGLTEQVRDAYQLRVVNREGKQYFFVNGREVAQSAYKFAPSKVGLIASGGQFIFNGITCFKISN